MASFTTTRGTVGYELLPEIHERFTDHGQQEIIQNAIVDSDNKNAFITAIMPDVATTSTVSGDRIRLSPFTGKEDRKIEVSRIALTRLLPQEHPARSGYFVCDAQFVKGAGWPKAVGNDLQFRTNRGAAEATGKAIVQITFRTLPYNATTADASVNVIGASELTRYVSRKMNSSHKNLPLPGRRLKLYEPRGTPATMTHMGGEFLESVTKAFSWQHLTYTWHMVPTIPQAATFYGGKVNLVDFDTSDTILMRGYGKPGTLLYLGANLSEPYSTITGVKVYDISYQFLRMAELSIYNTAEVVGHNHLYSPQHNKWGRAWFPQRHTDVPAVWQLAEFVAFAASTPSSFSGPEPAGCNVYDYVDLNNLFKLDVAA